MSLPQHRAAIAEVHAFLEDAFGYNFALRNPRASSVRLTLNSQGDFEGLKWLDIRFPPAFPFVSAGLYVDEQYILKVPHVESGGKVCLSDGCDPRTSPVDRVSRLLALFSEQMETLFFDQNKAYAEFHREGLSYWLQYLALTSKKGGAWTYFGLDDPQGQARRLSHAVGDPGRRTGYVAERKSEAHAWLGWDDEKRRDKCERKVPKTKPIETLSVLELRIERSLIPPEYPESIAQITSLLRMLVADETSRLAAQSFVETIDLSRKGDGRKLLVLHGPGFSQGLKLEGTNVTPVKIDRLDPKWTVARDTSVEFSRRANASVICLGAGSLGASTLELICRAGLLDITIVDKEMLEPPNLGRHTLTAHALREPKAIAMAERLRAAIPGCKATGVASNALTWLLESQRQMQDADLIVDMTGDPEVRAVLEAVRSEHDFATPLVVGWLEPFAAAAHAIMLQSGCGWFVDGRDPAEELVNIAQWSQKAFVKLPFCGASFQPYGPAAMAHGAALLAECILDVIDGKADANAIRSWIRGRSDFPFEFVDTFNPGWIPENLPEFGSIKVRPWL